MKYDLAERPNPSKKKPSKHPIDNDLIFSQAHDLAPSPFLIFSTEEMGDDSEVWRLESFDPRKDQVILDLSAVFLGYEIWIFSHGIWKRWITPGLPVPFELNK